MIKLYSYFQLHVLRKLLQNDIKNPTAPLGDNYRPPQPLYNRLLRTNIDFSGTKVRNQFFNVVYKLTHTKEY